MNVRPTTPDHIHRRVLTIGPLPVPTRNQPLFRSLLNQRGTAHTLAAPAITRRSREFPTPREREVLMRTDSAACAGNREIADTLVINAGTVEGHVKHILSKPGFRSRTQVAAWVADSAH